MIFAENRKVNFDYEIIKTYEAGLVLEGWEVKSIRCRNLNMRSAWVKIEKDKAFIHNLKITAWRFGDTKNQDPLRLKPLLLHKKELIKLEDLIAQKKYTLLPLKIYGSKGRIKCEIALGKGLKRYEKKQVLKEKSIQREAEKTLKGMGSS